MALSASICFALRCYVHLIHYTCTCICTCKCDVHVHSCVHVCSSACTHGCRVNGPVAMVASSVKPLCTVCIHMHASCYILCTLHAHNFGGPQIGKGRLYIIIRGQLCRFGNVIFPPLHLAI